MRRRRCKRCRPNWRACSAGEITATIAHEINQPLAAIVTNANSGLRWLGNKTPDLAEARNALRRIVSDGHRASEVIAGIRAMFRRSEQASAYYDVNALIREVLALVNGELKSNKVEARIELSDGIPKILADRVQLQQVVLNLVMNGIDAMASLRDRARVLELRSEQAGPSRVTLMVEDAGTGIDQNVIGRVFEAFFTTKPKGKGTGLGLAVVQQIVLAHGWEIECLPNEPKGAVFRITHLKLAGH